MKKDSYNDERNKNGKKSTGLNAAVIASVIAFLLTLSIGAIVLFAMGANNRNIDNIAEEESLESDTQARVPGATKIEDPVVNNSSKADGGLESNQFVNEPNAKDLEGTENQQTDYIEDNSEAGDTNADDNEDNSEEIAVVDEASITDPQWEHLITPQNADYVSLAFAGDILFDPGYAIMNKIRQNGGGIDGVIGGSLLSYMRSADIMVVNNEFPYSYGGTPTEGKTFTFRAEPSSAELLNQMGVDVATLANNHAYDYGQTALLDTLSAIDSVGVARVGAGANLDEASHPVYYMASNGLKIAIIAATEIERIDNPDTKGATDSSPGVFRCLDITKLVSRIKEAKSTGAYVIVCIHWGTENKEEIDWWQEKQGPEIADAGADLIVGAHPHILQKIGYINGIPVVYSLGNYLFNSKELDTGLLRVNIYTDGHTQLQFVPAVQSGCTVAEATGDRKTAILNHMRSISPGVSIDEEGFVQ